MGDGGRLSALRDRALLGARRRSIPPVLGAVGLAIGLLVLSPLLWLFIRANSISVERWLHLLTMETTIDVTLNSIVLVVAVTILSILIGVPLAILTVQTDIPFRRFWTITSALPLVVPSYIGAFAFVSAFGPRGELAGLLAPLGIEEIPSIYGLLGTTLVLTLFTYPYVYLTTRAALLSFDGSIVEAARSLNASRTEAFRRVTLPQIAPGIAAGSLLVALYVLSDFGTPSIMGYDVFTRMIYNEMNARLDYAAILSLLLVGLAIAIVWVESRVGGGGREGAYVTRGSRRPGTIKLGRWTYPALAFCSTIAFLCLALPVGILLHWLNRGGLGFGGGGFAFEPSIAWTSVGLAAAAALACVVLAIPVAYLASLSDGWLGTIPDRMTYVGYAVPGVVIGLALIYLGLSYLPFLYGSIVLLVFAYVVRFLPQAVGSTKSSLLQVDPHYVDAARSLGEPPLSAFRRVVLPLVMPGIIAGAALVFLTTMKELPATLILAPSGIETFVTYIWLVQGAGYYGQAAIPALVLVVVSGLSMLVLLGRERYDVT